MADFSLCKTTSCPRRGRCYRNTAIPDMDWQSYVKPEREGDACDMFMKQPKPISKEEYMAILAHMLESERNGQEKK